MAVFGSMNVSTSVTPTNSVNGTFEWTWNDTQWLIGVLVPASILIILTIVTLCLKYCRKGRGNGPPLSTPEEQIGFNPLNADPGTWDMNTCRDKLIKQYSNVFISTHPYRTDQHYQAAVDEIYTEMPLCQDDYKQVPKERLGKLNNDVARTKPLDTLNDLLDAEKIEELLIILSGGAGYGKSTILKKIVDTWAKRDLFSNIRLLFFLELKQMKTPCVIDAILDQCFQLDEQPARDDLIKIITDNHKESVFLLDGLDERPDLLAKPEENTEYNKFCLYNVLHNKVLRDCRVLVATRPHMVEHLQKDNQKSALIHTSGFTPESTNLYIKKHIKDDNKADKLIKCLQEKEMWKNMARIPLLCQIMCVVFSEKNELPDRETTLITRFTEVLAKRRCRENESWEKKLDSELKDLGKIAFEALIDGKHELVFEFDHRESVLGKSAPGEIGFIQLASDTSSSLDEKIKVTFLHKTSQEYSAAYFFAHLYDENKEEFHERLQQINPGNVRAMQYLLRFACGISSGSPATWLILKHVQTQRTDKTIVQRLTRRLLYESCDKLADKLDRPTDARCDSQEDLLAMRYYLQGLHQPLVELKELTVRCTSHEELAPLRGIDRLLHDDTTVDIYLSIDGRLHDCLKLLGEILPIDNDRSIRRFHVSVTYFVPEKSDEERETPVEVDERLRDQIKLEMRIDEKSHVDERELGSLSRVCKQILKRVNIIYITHDVVIRLADVMTGCDWLNEVEVFDINLHGHLAGVGPLVPRSLKSLTLHTCGLNDDDIPDLVSILPAGHGLQWLDVRGNAFSVVGVETLAAHLKNLPELRKFWLKYEGPDAERVKQVVEQNLPNVDLL